MTEPSSVSTSEPVSFPTRLSSGVTFARIDRDAGACVGARFADLARDVLRRLSELLAGPLERSLDAADLRFEGIGSDGMDVDRRRARCS